MLKEIKENYTRLTIVAIFLGLCFSVFLISVSLVIINFLSMQDIVNENSFTNTEFLIGYCSIAILIILEMSYIIPKYRDQIIISSKGIPKYVILIADFILLFLLLTFMESFINENFCNFNMSALSSLSSIVSGSIISPIVKIVKNVPIIKVEILNDKVSYNKDSKIELNINDYISVRVINPENDPQVVKFLGFCFGNDIDHIVNENNIQQVKFFSQANEDTESIIPMIETVDPHSKSKEYTDISLYRIIMTYLKQVSLVKILFKQDDLFEMINNTLFKQDKNTERIRIAAVYQSGDGNIFFKTFFVKI